MVYFLGRDVSVVITTESAVAAESVGISGNKCVSGDTAADAKASSDNGCSSIIVCRREEMKAKAKAAGATLIVSTLTDVDLKTFLH